MSDAAFVVAGYVIVVGGVAAYAVALRRRVAAARERLDGVRSFAQASAREEAPETRRVARP
ncbi:MAG: hypothetical protein ACYDAN_14835 [Candidatus Limnocylindrales bacterium]